MDRPDSPAENPGWFLCFAGACVRALFRCTALARHLADGLRYHWKIFDEELVDLVVEVVLRPCRVHREGVGGGVVGVPEDGGATSRGFCLQGSNTAATAWASRPAVYADFRPSCTTRMRV